MPKHPRLSRTSRHAGSHSSDAEPGYAIGYGRPPEHRRFKPGESGNPKGRPKRQRNLRTVVEETLSERIRIREGDRTRSISKLDAVVLTIVNRAVQGDPKAQASLLALLRSSGLTDEIPEADHQEAVTANDGALIADYLQRLGSELQQPAGAQSNERATVVAASSVGRRAA